MLRGVNKAERCGAKALRRGTSGEDACDEIKTGPNQESPNARLQPRRAGEKVGVGGGGGVEGVGGKAGEKRLVFHLDSNSTGL